MKSCARSEFPAEPEWMSAVLEFMDELAGIVAMHSDFETTLNWVVQRVKMLLGCDEVCIRSFDPAHGVVGKTVVFRRERRAGSWPDVIGDSVIGFVVGSRQPLFTSDLLNDARFPALVRKRCYVRALMAAPIQVENAIVGVIAASETEPGRRWTDGERWAFEAIARHCGPSIEGVKLREVREQCLRLEADQKQWFRDNDHASRLQRSVLPSRPLSFQGWSIAGRVHPARDVGGDGYQIHPLGDGRICLSVYDVMGKGLPAAMVMVAVNALLRELCTGEHCIKEAMQRLDRDISAVHDGTMVTLFHGELDTETGRLFYHRAGHPLPLLRRRDGSTEPLEAGSHPLGLGLEGEREIGEVRIGRGEGLLLYSDGITEAMNTENDFFGEDRLRALLQHDSCACPQKTVARVMRAVNRFCGRRLQHDDMTVVMLGTDASVRPAA